MPEPVEAAARESPPRAPLAAATVPVRAPNWSRRRLEILRTVAAPGIRRRRLATAVHACRLRGGRAHRRRSLFVSLAPAQDWSPVAGRTGSSSRSGTTESCSSKPLSSPSRCSRWDAVRDCSGAQLPSGWSKALKAADILSSP